MLKKFFYLKIKSNTEISKKKFILVLNSDNHDFGNIKSAQYFNIRVSKNYLWKPFSILNNDDNNLTFYYKVSGPGTTALSSKKTNDIIQINGSYGPGFIYPQFKKKNILFIAAGTGLSVFHKLYIELKKNNVINLIYTTAKKEDNKIFELFFFF